MSDPFHKSLNKDVGDLIALAPEVEDFLARRGVAAGAVIKVRVALEEIILNLIKHATGSASRRIDVGLEVEAGRVVLVIEDDGAPFDPRSAPEFDRDRPLEARRPGGMGLQVVRSLADEIHYERLPARNRLRLVVARP
jgi:serine/threonine-protein kinase RsbW